MPTERIPFHIMDEVLAHADDPVQPVTVQIEAKVAGRFDETKLHDALHAAMAAHPLMRARLEPWSDADVGYEWLVDPDPLVDPFRVVTAGADDLDDVRAELYSRPLSLFESPPLRALLVRGPTDDTLMLSLHHSASDGMGAQRFLRSILLRYAELDDPLPPYGPEQARSLAVPQTRPSGSEILNMAKLELKRMGKATSRASTLTADGGASRSGYGFHTMIVAAGPVVGSTLRKEEGATVNDMLIAAASRAAARWIEEHDEQAAKISVSMPINARPAEWSTEVVANLVSGESVSTIANERTSPRRCLAAVAGWTEAVKKRGPGPAVAALARVPHRGVKGRRAAIKAAAWSGGGTPIGTMVLSNLGRIAPDWLGPEGPEISGVFFSPPTAMPSGLGMGAVAHDDVLALTLRYRWAMWSSDAAARFAGLLESELDELSEG